MDKRTLAFTMAVIKLSWLEQTIQRNSPGPGGHVIVGASDIITTVAEFELLYHEIGAITNLLQRLTTYNAEILNHLEADAQHELSARKGLIFDKMLCECLTLGKHDKTPSSLCSHM